MTLNETTLFPLVLTLLTYQIGVAVKKKWNYQVLNPILISAVLVICILFLLGYPLEAYDEGCKNFSWLLTPATVCFAVPLYEQLRILRKHLPWIIAGIVAGVVSSLLCIYGLCRVLAMEDVLLYSLLPKSITTAMGIVVSAQLGGIPALTTAAIIITGILGACMGTGLCKILRIKHPIAQGVAFGTASHVMGTSRATEISELTGAVSSLALVIAGILTSALCTACV